MSRTVYGIGETIYDIIFKDGQPQAAKAGGSTFNALVSLGRVGVDTSFVSKIGDDKVGKFIMDFMMKNHISTQQLTIWEGHKTDVALAFLNKEGDAHYSFYKEYDKQFVEAEIPPFKSDDILLFGSYFSLNPLLKPLLERILLAAKAAGCIIYYDPNFRESHLSEVDELMPSILRNIEQATVVRGSDEDFKHIFGEDKRDLSSLKSIAPQLLITRNSLGVDVFDEDKSFHFDAKPLVPVSTIGAGDSFNAGFIYALIKYDIRLVQMNHLCREDWRKLVSTAIDFSTEVCQSYDNYISTAFALKMK